MEMTNDIQFLLPIMVTIMVSKWVGDLLTHSFYHALLEVRISFDYQGNAGGVMQLVENLLDEIELMQIIGM